MHACTKYGQELCCCCCCLAVVAVIFSIWVMPHRETAAKWSRCAASKFQGRRNYVVCGTQTTSHCYAPRPLCFPSPTPWAPSPFRTQFARWHTPIWALKCCILLGCFRKWISLQGDETFPRCCWSLLLLYSHGLCLHLIKIVAHIKIN